MQLIPDGVVKATSSPSGVLVPPRRATWKSALSTGPAAWTQAITWSTGTPDAGAAALVAGVAPLTPGGRRPFGDGGEMGVSLVDAGVSAAGEQAVGASTAAASAANTTAKRIRPG